MNLRDLCKRDVGKCETKIVKDQDVMIWVCQEQKGYHSQEFGLRQFPSWSNLSDGTWRIGGYSMK